MFTPSTFVRDIFANSVNSLLWIDALCINQDNISERSAQVQLMDKIYQQASRVLIYLGEAESGSDNAMDSIAQRHSDKYSTQMGVLDFFQRRPWFNRVWVLQEVALADCALAICGSKCVPWAWFPCLVGSQCCCFRRFHPELLGHSLTIQLLSNARRCCNSSTTQD